MLTHTHLYHSTQTEEDAPAPGSDELPSAPTPSRISKFIQRVAERPDGRSAGMREDMMVHEAERPEINLVVSIVIGVISMVRWLLVPLFFAKGNLLILYERCRDYSACRLFSLLA